MFYNWRKIDGYNAPIEVVIGMRGLGKTFGKVKECIKKAMNGDKFVYICETRDDVKTLSQNKGERFFSALKEYLETNKSKNNNKMYNFLFGDKGSEIDDELDDNFKSANVSGGTIKAGGETIGYLLALNAYSNLKRNNFNGVKTIIFDEFLPEEIDITHLKIAKKLSSLIQSIARRNDVKIYLLGNSTRLDDILLVKLGLDNLKKGEIRKIKDKNGVLIVGHYVNENDYKEYMTKLESSVSGRLSRLLDEDNLNKNNFKGEIGQDLLIPKIMENNYYLFKIKGKIATLRFHMCKKSKLIYCLNDYGKSSNIYCVDKRMQEGEVIYAKDIKDLMLDYFVNNKIRFESSVTYSYFKQIFGLDISL